MDKVPVLALVLFLIAGYFVFMKRSNVDGPQARELVRAGARLVDVRTPGEFAGGHITGAVNIPLQELESRIRELHPNETPIVLYCRSGHRSNRAASVLKGAGFTAVHDLGAMGRW